MIKPKTAKKNRRITPDFFLTRPEIEAEARERLRFYRKARKGKSGPEPHWRMFIVAGYLSLKRIQGHGTRLTEADADVIFSHFGINPDPKGINRWIHGHAYRSTLEQEGKEFTRWIGGPFSTAVSMVIKGLEGKPAPTRRELLRRFRAPGGKNCSLEELSRYRGMIDQAAAEITAPPKPLDLDELRKSDLFPRD
jgi:hypothetical protein